MLDEICLGDTVLYRSVYAYINSNMYAMVESGEAFIVDPHKNDELTRLLKDRGVSKVTILLTHEHHDHTTGNYWYQENFESMLVCQRDAAECISKRQYLRPLLIALILGEEDRINGTHRYEGFKREFVPRQYKADVTYSRACTLKWQGHVLQFYHIPGHSLGSSLIVMDRSYAFTGDSLLNDYPIILRFPGSSKEQYNNVALPLMQRVLTEDMTILPGHGEPFKFKETMKDGKIHVQFR